MVVRLKHGSRTACKNIVLCPRISWLLSCLAQGLWSDAQSAVWNEDQLCGLCVVYVCCVSAPAQGEHAHRIWSAIYNQSCFTDGVSCSEERVFYRLISGMHASISCHLSSDYLLDEQQGIWGPNMTEFKQRLGTPETR